MVGAAWVTPVVLSATAGPAMASGTVCPSSLTLTGSAQLLPNGTFPLTNAGCPVSGVNYTTAGSCLTSNTVTYVWKEAGPVTLAAPLPVNRNGCAGTNFSLGTGTYSIPTGTTVCGLFVRADTIVSTPLSGSLQLPSGFQIVGLASSKALLQSTDAAFALPVGPLVSGRKYNYHGSEATDRADVSSDRRTFTWRFANASAIDEIRVFVAQQSSATCPP